MIRPSCRFEFIRKLCVDLSEEEVTRAEARFAAYLDVVAQIVERRRAQERGGDNRFDETGLAPYDSIPPAPGV